MQMLGADRVDKARTGTVASGAMEFRSADRKSKIRLFYPMSSCDKIDEILSYVLYCTCKMLN